jgi:hypothetical protein
MCVDGVGKFFLVLLKLIWVMNVFWLVIDFTDLFSPVSY